MIIVCGFRCGLHSVQKLLANDKLERSFRAPDMLPHVVWPPTPNLRRAVSQNSEGLIYKETEALNQLQMIFKEAVVT
jgi:hypothetical protein